MSVLIPEQPNHRNQALEKTLSLPQIIALYIGAVLGSGVLFIPGIAAEISGPASIISWLAMAVLVVPLALTMGLLSAIHPSAGGVSHFVRIAWGETFGHITGWFFLLSVVFGAPILAVTGASYLSLLFSWEKEMVYLTAALILLTVLAMNFIGLKLAGIVQTGVVAIILAILLMAIGASVPHYSPAHFSPFVPHGWLSVFQTMGLLFWCFIGWEAVSHLSEEFVDAKKDAVHGVLWSAGVVTLLYVAVAFMTVATGSYGNGISETALSIMVQKSFGPTGGWIVAVAALFICIATANAYLGAAARVAYSLAGAKAAPRWFGILHKKYRTPIGGLFFLASCFTIVLLLLFSGVTELKTLIQLPNASFFATYIAGCLAGIRLLKETRLGRVVSWTSLILTLALYPSLGWAALYPFALAAVIYIGHGMYRK